MKKMGKVTKVGVVAFLCVSTLGSACGMQKGVDVDAAANQAAGWSVDANVEKQNVCLQLQKDGFTKEAAAGIVGNLQTDSTMNPYIREIIGNHNDYEMGPWLAGQLDPDNDTYGPGRGLMLLGDGTATVGMSNSRWLNLIRYVNKRFGKNYPLKSEYAWNDDTYNDEDTVKSEWPNAAEQASFIREEMQKAKGQRGNVKMLNGQKTPEAAAIYFNREFNGSSELKEAREAAARDTYQKYCDFE